jgi:hypothetical protein
MNAIIRERELLARLSEAIMSGRPRELEKAREELRKFYHEVLS